jgi:Flp pilus assembly protein TadG
MENRADSVAVDGPRGRRRSERGAVAVEFALIAPVLFLLIFGIIDFGFGFQAWDGSAAAAREGARVGIINPNVGDIEARVRAASSFLDQSRLNVAVTCSRGGSPFGPCPASTSWVEGDIVRVTVTYDYGYITPLPHLVGLGDDFHVTAITEGRFEGQ